MRIDELQAKHQGRATSAAVSERLASAQRHLAASQAAAEQAIAAAVRAFRMAAEAHERVALLHERAAAAGSSDIDEHERQAAIHRAAAMADAQRAEHAQSMLRLEEADGPREPDADQALHRYVNLAARRTADLPPPVRLADADGAVVTIAGYRAHHDERRPDEFHRQLLRVAELSGAAGTFLVRAMHDETRGWQWVTEPL